MPGRSRRVFLHSCLSWWSVAYLVATGLVYFRLYVFVVAVAVPAAEPAREGSLSLRKKQMVSPHSFLSHLIVAAE